MAASGGGDFKDRFYVLEWNRSAGIQVYTADAPPNVNVGDTLTVIGWLTTTNGERALTAPIVMPITSASSRE